MIIGAGDIDVAERLKGTGVASYPGNDELKYVARYVGGAIGVIIEGREDIGTVLYQPSGLFVPNPADAKPELFRILHRKSQGWRRASFRSL